MSVFKKYVRTTVVLSSIYSMRFDDNFEKSCNLLQKHIYISCQPCFFYRELANIKKDMPFFILKYFHVPIIESHDTDRNSSKSALPLILAIIICESIEQSPLFIRLKITKLNRGHSIL